MTVTTDTYYTVLGVSEKASQEDVKRAWQELLKQVHPDKMGSAPDYWRKAAEDKTKEVNEAYQVLSDSAKRRQYDQLLEALRATQTPPQSQYQAPPQTHNAPPQAPTAAPSSTPTPTGFGTGRYDWAATILIPLVIILVAAAENSHPFIAAIVGVVFLVVVGFSVRAWLDV
jgi:curved DNA-binding protein CbpA